MSRTLVPTGPRGGWWWLFPVPPLLVVLFVRGGVYAGVLGLALLLILLGYDMAGVAAFVTAITVVAADAGIRLTGGGPGQPAR